MMRGLEMKYIGCLFGGAIGDALGVPLTGRTRAEIAEMGTVREFVAALGVAPVTLPLSAIADAEYDDPLLPGQWTDDTQLTLGLAEALIAEGGMFVPDAWGHALVRWLNEAPRAPGLASLQAAIQLRSGGALWDEAADPEGGGCGAATRVSPIGLVYSRDADQRRRYAYLQAMTTHGQPDAQAAAVAVAEAVAYVLSLDDEGPSSDYGMTFLTKIIDVVSEFSSEFAEFARCLDLARTLLFDGIDAGTAVRVLGVSAWSREAVPTALYLVARNPHDFEQMMIDAINLTGGAVESIATMVGSIGGALHGVQAIPARWRREVEDAPRLLETALKLHRLQG
jgi:poly(ADP-ribose) glycohydrolase ARH3